ncbi:MAG: DNA topoisomerase IV subunit A [Myxococcota bacterium]|nr:DNA topoisomerase IV subunit A [Myxococcota bacterium]MDW8363459.1 DNA topoisomerase IV subunit A [Myxococcales bacterium]
MARRKKDDDQLILDGAASSDASLAEEARRRYLTYALSVITSRALPDVRDGLKPVQRRILYTMAHNLRLGPDEKPKKCAAIVGEVMGKYHPHGDAAIYEALVRMAQPFSMRMPLVDGHGNFGSPDGDAPAAFRYTEARLTPIAIELLAELDAATVPTRPTYDNQSEEPVVLPARFPHLLVNGSQGIAVGMATSIPPHHLGEVVQAAIAMIDEPDLDERALLRIVRGPDFPTGGELVASRAELLEVYTTGQGSLRLRGTWKLEEGRRGVQLLVITSIPYGCERRAIVEKIAEIVTSRKLPLLLDVRDESTEQTRIVCELRRDADPSLVVAYLYRHTPLSVSVPVNLTCLVPSSQPLVGRPERLSLRQILRHFLDFRLEVVTRRLEHERDRLRARAHVLEGFARIFDALDEVLRIIRRSEGRQDAAARLMKRFELDAEQVDAILELRLYRLARLEILVVQRELEQARARLGELDRLLASEQARWKLVRAELHELATRHRDERRTRIVAEDRQPAYDEEAFIVEEDAMVVLTQQGWVKRQQTLRDVGATRVREGDQVLEVALASTRAPVAFFSNRGVCYVTRAVEVPATTGYGVPVQTLFKLEDGERIVAMTSFDSRVLEVPPPSEQAAEPEPPFALAVSRAGLALRFSLRAHREPSTRAGRRYARPEADDEIVCVEPVGPDDVVACATVEGRALLCRVDEIPVLAGPGKGVRLIRLAEGDRVLGARVLRRPDDALVVETSLGGRREISRERYEVVSRAGRGFEVVKKGRLERVLLPEPTLPGAASPASPEGG